MIWVDALRWLFGIALAAVGGWAGLRKIINDLSDAHKLRAAAKLEAHDEHAALEEAIKAYGGNLSAALEEAAANRAERNDALKKLCAALDRIDALEKNLANALSLKEAAKAKWKED